MARVPGWTLASLHEDSLHFMWQGVARDLGGALSRDLYELEQIPFAIQLEEFRLYCTRASPG